METYGATLRRLRQERGQSLEHLAGAAGVSAGRLSQIERGTHGSPTLATMVALALALDLESLEVAFGDLVITTTVQQPTSALLRPDTGTRG